MDYDDLVKYLLDIREEEAADAITKLRAERDNAIAECVMHIGNAKALRAERDEWHNVATAAGLRIVDIRAERDALRALLREARAALPDMRHNELLRAKLDAALAGKDAP